MVINTSDIKEGCQMNTALGTFERIHLFIGYKEGRRYSLTMLSCPGYGHEEKVDKNSLTKRLTLFCCLPYLS